MVYKRMRSFLNGGKYSYKPTHGFRSGLEQRIMKQIQDLGFKCAYEEYLIPYTIPASEHTYCPDFVLSNGIIVETKGLWEPEDRKKHLLLKQQYPQLDIRFVFQASGNKIYKGSKTTYAMFCDKYNIKYAQGSIPIEWFKEKKRKLPECLKRKKK